MKIIFSVLMLLWLGARAVFAVELATAQSGPLAAKEHQGPAARMVATVLSRYHYKALPLDDVMSAKAFDNYIKVLDADKVFFLQGDIARFQPYRAQLDDAIAAEDVRIPFTIYESYRKRLKERFEYARSLLATPPDFTVSEVYEYERKDAAWALTEADLREHWRKRVKSDWLQLRLSGQKDEAIRKTLGKRYDGYLTRMQQSTANDVFQVFMDAYATAVDPHTNYLGPRASEEFDIAMRLSLVGIGAVLQMRDEYATIRELVPGGPAALSGKLAVGDRIVRVSQGRSGEAVEVVGWRLDDIVRIIRGNLDSVVVLDVLSGGEGPDGKRKLVALTRKKVSIEAQAAKSSLIEVKEAGTVRKLGVISLPSFYEDFEGRRNGERDFRSASRDVARLIGELKKQGVEGLVLDLRNNGGGALGQAVEVTGLFIDKGPVVQQRNSQGQVGIEEDTKLGQVWAGPLAVLINRGSASASEILAGAIQDYGRGVILGETSFGKGTVQTVLNLDQAVKAQSPLFGEVKMTVAEFFRVTGVTTQLNGVAPDIAFPSLTDAESIGEASFENALPPEIMPAATYDVAGEIAPLLPQMRVRHEARLKSDPELKRVLETSQELTQLRKRKAISLNEMQRRAERKEREARLGKDEGEFDDDADFPPVTAASAPKAKGARAELKKKPKKADPLLLESARVLADHIDFQAMARIASKTAPAKAVSAVGK